MNSEKDSLFPALDDRLGAETASVRKRGLVRFLTGAGATAAVICLVSWLLPKVDAQLTPYGLMSAAIPGGIGLTGLLESVTGIPYREWARRWDSLKGWQRGVLGTFIALAFFVLIGMGIVLFVH